MTTEYSILNEHLQYPLQDSGDITKEIWRKFRARGWSGVLWNAVFQAWHRQCLHSQLTRFYLHKLGSVNIVKDLHVIR